MCLPGRVACPLLSAQFTACGSAPVIQINVVFLERRGVPDFLVRPSLSERGSWSEVTQCRQMGCR